MTCGLSSGQASRSYLSSQASTFSQCTFTFDAALVGSMLCALATLAIQKKKKEKKKLGRLSNMNVRSSTYISPSTINDPGGIRCTLCLAKQVWSNSIYSISNMWHIGASPFHMKTCQQKEGSRNLHLIIFLVLHVEF